MLRFSRCQCHLSTKKKFKNSCAIVHQECWDSLVATVTWQPSDLRILVPLSIRSAEIPWSPVSPDNHQYLNIGEELTMELSTQYLSRWEVMDLGKKTMELSNKYLTRWEVTKICKELVIELSNKNLSRWELLAFGKDLIMELSNKFLTRWKLLDLAGSWLWSYLTNS